MKHQAETPFQSPFQSPLSIAQERLWFLSQLDPDSALYNEPTAVRLRGSLDIQALKSALVAILERHEILRTTLLLTEEAAPVQLINDCRPIDLPVIDLSSRPREKREDELQSLLVDLTKRPFDLTRDFPWRATLLKLGSAEHVLLLVTHHISSDEGSGEIMWRELVTLYRAFAAGKPNPLPELPTQYPDYVVWQRQWLKGAAAENHLAYWKQQLSDVSALELPTDRPRPAVQTFRGGKQSFQFSQSLSEQLKAFRSEEGVTLFTTLLAAFKTLLHRYTGQDDIPVGSPIAGRTSAELEGLIGLFANTLVFRTDLSGNPTFRELLDRVRKVTLAAHEHRDLPFEKLIDEIHLDRDLSRSPLFQVMFAHQNAPRKVPELPGLSVSSVEINNETAKFDLSLRTWDEPHGLRGELEYSTDLFDAATIRRMLGHFETLLQAIVTNPDRRIFNLPILAKMEKHQLLVEWNDTKKDYPKDKCIHQLFEAQVERSPDSVAAVFADHQVTYRELNSKANELAHYLRKLGVGPEILVGVCVERSLDMIVGLLGILKAGGAYVPLDPAYPKERLAFVLQDAQVSVLLTQQRLLATLPTTYGTQVLCLDTDWAQVARQIDTNPDNRTTSKNLAYVIYTSGSTGKPKGVAIEHFSAATFLLWAHSVFTKEDLTGVLASTSICFDLSVFELFAPLTCGGKIILAENALALPGLSAASEVTLINTVPSAMAELVRLNGIPPSVRTINLAGEALSTSLVQQIYETTSAKRVYDLYGPSEDTTYSTYALRTPHGPKTIGRPISNTRVYVLDGHMDPVPIGILGQLYIGGDGLARGYFNRPDLTAEKFIPDPFSGSPGARLYNTGDLARYLPDGNIEFIGRVDNQVKLRGFRIELGEIESVLVQHPEVQAAAAIVREDTPGAKRLVAYIVPEKAEAIPTKELRSYLGSKLPDYMVPSAFVTLAKLPLTPNGKVDRRALPTPDQRSNLEETFIAPSTPTEQAMAKIWANLLKLERVGIHDNFFELGGHSLLALRLISQINETFGKKLPLAAVFQAPTIEQLTRLVAGDIVRPTWSSLYAIQPQGSKPPFFWIHGENSDPFLPRYLGSDQPLYGVRHQSEDGKPARYTTVRDIAEHYLSEIRAAHPHGPYLLGGYCVGGMVAFEIAQQLKKLNEDVALLVMLDPANPNAGEFSASSALPVPDYSANGKSLRSKVSRHLGILASLKSNEKIRYILEKAVGKARELVMNITSRNKTVKRAVYKTCLALGYPIPPSFRSRYILDVYDQAVLNYAPKVYPDRLVVLKAAYECDATRWESLAAGGLEVHEISGDHTTILKEPYMQQWGDLLRTQIERAQITGTKEPSARSPLLNIVARLAYFFLPYTVYGYELCV